MKNIIILVILLSFGISYSQTKSLKKNINDNNLKIEKIGKDIEQLKIKLNEQKSINEKSISKITSLNKELLFYKVKDDYYATALSEQSTRFALIVSGILVLFTLISFKSFRYEVSTIKKFTNNEIKKIETEFKEYKEKLSETSNELTGAKGNIYASIALYFKGKKNYETAFHYQLLAAKSHGLHKENGSSNDKTEEISYKTCITNLELAIEHLNQRDVKAKYLIDDKDTTKKILDQLNTLKDGEVKDLSAKIRILFNDIINVA